MNPDHFWNLLAKKLANEASAQELEELTLLIKQYPELAFAAQHVANLWQTKAYTSRAESEAGWQKLSNRMAAEQMPEPVGHEAVATSWQKSGKRAKWLLPAFGVLVAGLALTALFLLESERTPAPVTAKQTEEIFTRPGTRTRLVLPDSSVVWLNAGSKLSYAKPFGEKYRTVMLTGEAFFDVRKSSQPFIIHTSGVQIQVLGTAFNVRSYPAEKKVETSLVRGRVEITLEKNPDKRYILLPNEKLLLNTEAATPQKPRQKTAATEAVFSTLHYLNDTTIAETSWVENKLVFDDESFAEVAQKMERWYGVTIAFKSEALKAEHFTGVFEKETVWQALEAMQLTTPFRFSIKNNAIILSH